MDWQEETSKMKKKVHNKKPPTEKEKFAATQKLIEELEAKEKQKRK